MVKMKLNFHSNQVFMTVLFMIAAFSLTTSTRCKVLKGKADCTNLQLTQIPKDLDPSIIYLDLQHNNISDLRGRPFERYNKLLFLELSFNHIEAIPNDTFYGLPHINYIALAVNELSDSSLHRCYAFNILQHLKTVDIGSNWFTKVPDVSIFNNHLSVLKFSSLNSKGSLQDPSLGKGFSKLTNLTKLYMQDMQIRNLTSSTFKYVSTTLELLWLQGNKITDIAKDTFSRLKKLQVLFLDANSMLSNDVIEDGLSGLVHTDIRNLSLRSMFNIAVIKNTTFGKLKNTPLEILDLQNSKIKHIDNDGFKTLGNLSKLILNTNYLEELYIHSLSGLSKLEELDLSENYELKSVGSSLNNLTNLRRLTFQGSFNFNNVTNQTLKGLHKLETLIIAETGISRIYKGTFSDLSSLWYLDLSSNDQLGNIQKGVFHGLKNVSLLNISRTAIQDFFDNFCEDIPKLKTLQSQDVKISELQPNVFQNCHHLNKIVLNSCGVLRNISTAFANMNSLKFLDISTNHAFAEAPMDGAFNISPKFDTLLYSDVNQNNSGISRIPSAIRYSTHINTLDIRLNEISYFNQVELDFFANLKHVKAQANPFNCTCDLISLFYYWLTDPEKRNNVILDIDLESYKCVTPRNESGRPIIYFNMRACNVYHINVTVAIISTILALIVVSLGIVGIVHYHWWTFKYFWYYVRVIRKKRNSPDEHEELDSSIEFDAFVSYSLSDIKFVKEVLLKNLESNGEAKSNEDFNYCTPSDARFKAHYQNTVSAIVMICIKTFKQTQRRVLYAPAKVLHTISCMCPLLVIGKRHPAVKVRISNHKQEYPLCMQIKTNKHTSKVCRKLIYKRRAPCYGTKILTFDCETIWLKKWVKPYIKIIRKLKEKDRALQRQLKQQRVQEEDVNIQTNNRLSINEPTRSSLPFAQGTHSPRFRSVQGNTLTTVSGTTRHQNTTVDIVSSNQSNVYNERMYCPIHADDLPRYKLMVCHRDFPPGGDIAETIVLYMEKSKKSIVCISDDFLKGDWTMFEWEITVRERNGAMLLVLLNPDIDRKKMPRYMRSLLKSKIYLEWTENDDHGKRYFWARLKEFLGKPVEEIRKEERNEKYIRAKKKELKRKNERERKRKEQEQSNGPGHWVKGNVVRNQQLPKNTWVSSKIFGNPLTLLERERILERHDEGWISKKIINASIALLHQQFPDIGGLQDCRCASRLSFESDTRPLVQILNMFLDKDSEIIGDVHWIVVSTINCNAGNIAVYDSQNFETVPEHVKMSIANLLQAHELNKYTINLMKSAQQLKDVDCGIYSIANVVALLYSYNPSTIDYVGSTQMRKHLVKCLENGKFSMFPRRVSKKFTWFSSSKKHIRHKRIVQIHCSCRMLWDINMIRCRLCARFFHPSCLGQIMPGAQFRAYRGNYELTCNDCKDKKLI